MLFCVFYHKTAYEMRISDGSSDVCSSDLFLQKASSFFYYDLESWAGPESLPPHSIEITRLNYLNGGGGLLQPSATPDYGLRFNYFDGLGRSQIGRASCRERVCQYV